MPCIRMTLDAGAKRIVDREYLFTGLLCEARANAHPYLNLNTGEQAMTYYVDTDGTIVIIKRRLGNR